MAGSWEHFRHGADIGVRGFGATREEAFEQAALAMAAVMADPIRVAERDTVTVTVRAPDDELLLVEWLDAIVYEVATGRRLFRRFEVDAVPGGLVGRLFGEPIDVPRHRPALEVKGATVTELAVGRLADGRWRAQCVVDV